MTPQKYVIYSLEDFAREFLKKGEIIKLGETIDRRHSWGDTSLVAISGYWLKKDLEYSGIGLPRWLEDHLDDLFEITGSTSTFWEEGS